MSSATIFLWEIRTTIADAKRESQVCVSGQGASDEYGNECLLPMPQAQGLCIVLAKMYRIMKQRN